MSTHIYDAYALNLLSMTDLNDLVQFLKHELIQAGADKLRDYIAISAANLIDTLSMYRSAPDALAILYDDYLQSLADAFDKAYAPINARIMGADKKSTKEETLDIIRNQKFLTPYWLSKNKVINHARIAEITGRNSPYYMKNTIVLFPMKNKTLLIAFGDQAAKLMRDIETSGKDSRLYPYKQKYNIRDFHYQNQTDRPEDITEEEWAIRSQTWDQAMPSGVPSEDGIVIRLTETASYEEALFHTGSARIAKLIKSKSERAKGMARQLTEASLLDTKDKLPSDICSQIRALQKAITDKQGEPYAIYWKFYEITDRVLPDITADTLSMPIRDLLEKPL